MIQTQNTINGMGAAISVEEHERIKKMPMPFYLSGMSRPAPAPEKIEKTREEIMAEAAREKNRLLNKYLSDQLRRYMR